MTSRASAPTCVIVQVYGKLVHLDNAASAQGGRCSIGSISPTPTNTPTCRGLHYPPTRRPRPYEGAREAGVPQCGAARGNRLHPQRHRAINLVAYTLAASGSPNVRRIVSRSWSITQHRAVAFLPSVMVRHQGAPIDTGQFLIDSSKLLTDRTKLVAITHVEHARHRGAGERGGAARPCARRSVLVDGAQAAVHLGSTCAISTATSTPSGPQLYGPTGSASTASTRTSPPCRSTAAR